jgi:hypothetical protein
MAQFYHETAALLKNINSFKFILSGLLPREIYVELAIVSIISDKKDSLVFVFISSYISFN